MPTCSICGGSGLVPFTKDGKVIANAYLNCACKPEPVEHYEPLKPEDFDYPCSASFRAASFEYCGLGDLELTPSQPEPETPREVIHRHSDMSQRDFALLKEHDNIIKYLLSKEKKKEQRQDYY
jgi:hypothetical protein